MEAKVSKYWRISSVNRPNVFCAAGLDADLEAQRRRRERPVAASIWYRGVLMRIYHPDGSVEDVRYQIRSVCAWCQVLLRDGLSPAGHGICDACADRVFSVAPVKQGIAATRGLSV